LLWMLLGMNTGETTSLVIVGGGAAGLMAACYAGESGLPCVLIERKHRVGSKLLMCGNGRCNLTTHLRSEAFLSAFGDELADFLRPSIEAFTPHELQSWFKQRGLPLMQTRDGKVFPKSERAPDVVHMFSDRLRDLGVPLCLNAPIKSIVPKKDGFTVSVSAFTLKAANVLVATGGVSYPKTGSVGDGQKMAGELGHRLQPYRPGLVGLEWKTPWLMENSGASFKEATAVIYDGQTRIGTTSGLLECERWGLGGGVISNATRLVARANIKSPRLEIVPHPGAKPLLIDKVKTRPLKEAMVTVGGVDLGDVSAKSMESRVTPGLYFAGEVLDIDGPTGGYNLTAAFATARTAVRAIAGTEGMEAKDRPPTPPRRKARKNMRAAQYRRRRRKG
jgi:hypothetical protein